MNPSQRALVVRLAERRFGKEWVARIQQMPFHDLGFGFDPFGQERETGIAALIATRWIYEKYFRVASRGHENIPQKGRAILVANHSGLLPMDGMMVGIDLIERLDPPRAMRAIADNWLADIPYISPFIQRAGQVIGHRRNFEKLLNLEELVIVFPEGTRGIGKPFKERYRLQHFGVGFLELSLLYKAPLIPVAIVGAEEQAPVIFRSERLARRFNLPYFPVTPTWPLFGLLGILPYPVKYRISYGEPVRYFEEYGPEAVRDQLLTRHLADEVKAKLQALLDKGVRERKGIFR